MSYRFELREGIASSFARIVAEQIDRVLDELQATRLKPTAIHESRKSLKRIRALLRLVRPAIGEHAFKSENARFRDVGAMFSHDRDRHVLLETAHKVAASMGAGFRKPMATLIAELSAPPKPIEGKADVLKDAIARLKSARREVSKLPFSPDSFEALENGLKLSYRRGRRQLHDVYAEPSDEGFHELRKCVQQHWRHMQVLQRAWPELFTARLAAARRLSQILGDDHDLAVLVAFVEASRTISSAHRRAIVRHCRHAQTTHRELAHPLCQQLFAERPGSFAKRIALVWHTSEGVAKIEAAKPAQKKPAKRDRKPPAKSVKSPAPTRKQGKPTAARKPAKPPATTKPAKVQAAKQGSKSTPAAKPKQPQASAKPVTIEATIVPAKPQPAARPAAASSKPAGQAPTISKPSKPVQPAAPRKPEATSQPAKAESAGSTAQHDTSRGNSAQVAKPAS